MIKDFRKDKTKNIVTDEPSNLVFADHKTDSCANVVCIHQDTHLIYIQNGTGDDDVNEYIEVRYEDIDQLVEALTAAKSECSWINKAPTRKSVAKKRATS